MNTDQLQLSIAMGMSRQADGLALSHFLLDTTAATLPEAKISLFEVFGNSGEETSQVSIRLFGENAQPRPPKPDDSGLIKAVHSKTPATVKNQTGDCRLIVPISSDNGPTRLIVFDNIADSPEIRTQALQIAELFGNQARLMDSRERDQLTGLMNRQNFAQYFQNTFDNALHSSKQMCLAVLDIDHFKRINDTYGHLFGDEVLLQFAQIMERTFRHTDPLFRFGGEEFIVLLVGDDTQSCQIALERFRSNIEHFDFPGVGKVTVSVGFAQCQQGELPTTVVDRADQALYYAKEHGRNQVICYADIKPTEETKSEESEIDLF